VGCGDVNDGYQWVCDVGRAGHAELGSPSAAQSTVCGPGGAVVMVAWEVTRPDVQSMPGHTGGQPTSASTLSGWLWSGIVRVDARAKEEFAKGCMGRALEQEILHERDGLLERLPWRRPLFHRADHRARLRGHAGAPMVLQGRHAIHDGETPDANRQPDRPAFHRLMPPQSPRSCRRALIEQPRDNVTRPAAVVHTPALAPIIGTKRADMNRSEEHWEDGSVCTQR